MLNASKIIIFDESGKALVAFMVDTDGSYEALGQTLSSYLQDFFISIERYTSVKSSPSMGALAGLLISFLHRNVGNVTVTDPKNEQKFNYDIRFVNKPNAPYRRNRLSLLGYTRSGFNYKTREFRLYGDEILPVKVLRKVSFVYDKRDGSVPTWRKLDVTEEDSRYICGMEDGTTYKKFLMSRIVGGRIITE